MLKTRHIQSIIEKVANQFPILLLSGPRQVGKTTVLRHTGHGKYEEISFDDPVIRQKVNEDPGLFLKKSSAASA